MLNSELPSTSLIDYYIFGRFKYELELGARPWFRFLDPSSIVSSHNQMNPFFSNGIYQAPPCSSIQYDSLRFFIESDTPFRWVYEVRHDPKKFTLLELNQKILDIEHELDDTLCAKAFSVVPRRSGYQLKSLNEHVYPCTFDELFQIKRFNLRYNAYIKVFDLKLRQLTSKYIKMCIQFQQNEIVKKELYEELHTYLPFANNFKKQSNMREISNLCIKILSITRINNIIKDKFYAYQEMISYLFLQIEQNQHGFFFKQRYNQAFDAVADPISLFARYNQKIFKNEKTIYEYRTTNLARNLFDIQHSPLLLLQEADTLPHKYEDFTKSQRLAFEKLVKLLKKQRHTKSEILARIKLEQLPLIKSAEAKSKSHSFYNKLYSTYVLNSLNTTKGKGTERYRRSLFMNIANHVYPKLLNPNRAYPNYFINCVLKQESLPQSFIFRSLSALCKLTNLPLLSSVELMVQKDGYPVGELRFYKALKKVVKKEIFSYLNNYKAHHSKWVLVTRAYEAERDKHLAMILKIYKDGYYSNPFLKKYNIHYEVPLTLGSHLKYAAHQFHWWLYKPSRSLRYIYLNWRMDITGQVQRDCNKYISFQNRNVVFNPSLQRHFYKRSFLGQCDRLSQKSIISIMEEFIMKDKKWDMVIKEKVKNHLLAGGNLESLLKGYGDEEIPRTYERAFRLAEEYTEFTGFNEQLDDILKVMEHDRWFIKYKNVVTDYFKERLIENNKRNVL